MKQRYQQPIAIILAAGEGTRLGANQPIEARHVAEALDDDDIDDLVTTTGIPRAQVLDEVAKALPEAIDHLTPNGRLPTYTELAELSSSYEAQARAGAT